MRLSHKLSLFAAVGIALVLGAYGVVRVRREMAVFEDDMRHDHRLLGIALSVAAASVASRGALESAVRLIEDADANETHISIHWVPERSHSHKRFINRDPASIVIEDEDDGTRYLVTHVPAALGHGVVGTIEFRESLAAERAYTRTTIFRSVAMTLATIGLCALIIVTMSWMIVGRPLGMIMAKVRRIGEGDLTGKLEINQGGEMHELARELDTMCLHLSEARERVAKETHARIAALEQLRHADRLTTVGKLASGIAHELGTPLNVVAARAKMIEHQESSGDEIIDDARAIREQAKRMTSIIRQLLDFARRKRAEKQLHDIAEIVTKTLSLLASLAKKSAVRLDGPSADQPVLAPVDAGQIEQVITNLVMNAIQAQPEGGVVRVSVEPVGTAEERSVVIVIEDDGPGVSEEIKQHIFEPFFTTKDVGEGTGLGLSVVYGIVQEHDGTIELDSETGKGSRFTVTLPAATAE